MVRRVNRSGFMRVTPAGMEISDRKTGTIRPVKTVQPPRRWKNASVRSMSEVLTKGTLARIRRVRSGPSQAPTPYRAHAPATEPKVHHRIAVRMVMLEVPVPAEKPARGRITSEGRGGKRFSRAIRKAAPGPPRVVMIPTAQAAIPVSDSAVVVSSSTLAPLVMGLQPVRGEVLRRRQSEPDPAQETLGAACETRVPRLGRGRPPLHHSPLSLEGFVVCRTLHETRSATPITRRTNLRFSSSPPCRSCDGWLMRWGSWRRMCRMALPRWVSR